MDYREATLLHEYTRCFCESEVVENHRSFDGYLVSGVKLQDIDFVTSAIQDILYELKEEIENHLSNTLDKQEMHDILERFDLIDTALNLNQSTVEEGIIYY